MPIEQTLSNIESHLARIAAALENQVVPAQPVAPAPDPVAATPPPAPAQPVAPAPAPPTALPFQDAAGLVTYVTETYKLLGPEKGMQIQGILTQMGHNNVTEIPTDKYGELYQQIEALKAA